MAAFKTSTDIANRALQHVGARRITSLLDNSKAASEVNACYDGLREAELRRNVWVAATRRAVLRPIDTTTFLLNAPVYNTLTAYSVGAVVKDTSGKLWQTPVATTGQTPGSDGSPWDLYCGPLTVSTYDATVAYFAGELVYQTDLHVYLSLLSGNTVAPPSAGWVDLGTGANSALTILYPIGAGPSSQNATRNVFHLPANWLREAPQAPKEGAISWLGAESGMQASDWEYNSNYIVSAAVDLIVYRFVANVTGVAEFDAMFCEGLACRIGIEVCEPLTQSTEKLQGLEAMYKQFMSEARQVNAIEAGYVMPEVDDWIACRA